MRLMTRVSVAFSTAAVLALSFAGIAPASAHAAVAVRAAAACPDTYSADRIAAANEFSTMAGTPAADKLSAEALKLVQLRYKYEDTAVPAGCEADQVTNVKGLTLLEDGALLLLGTLLDTKNAAAYNDVISKVWLDRTKAFAAATPAVPAAAATATAPVVCKDVAYTNKMYADLTSINLKQTDTDPVVIGAVALKVLALQYAYEDATSAPATCADALQLLVKLWPVAIDQVVLTLAKVGDKANAATYDAFISKDLTDRGNKISGSLGSVIDISLVTPPTAAATASK